MVVLLGFAEDENVIHVHDYHSLIYEFFEYVIHHFLEHFQTVCGTKEHDQRFKQALVHSEGSFHSSPSLIPTLLYSQHTSSLVKYFTLALDILLRMSGIKGR